MNFYDIIFISILVFISLYGFFRGFIGMILNGLRILLSLALTKAIYPIISKLLYISSFYTDIQNGLKASLPQMESSKVGSMSGIMAMEIPDFMKEVLIENNNRAVYSLLGVETVGDYISSFLAQILVNIISAFIVFLVVSILIRLLTHSLQIFSRIPILSSLDKIGGLFVGATLSLLLVWVLFSLLGIYFTVTNANQEAIYLLNHSLTSRILSHGILFINQLMTITR